MIIRAHTLDPDTAEKNYKTENFKSSIAVIISHIKNFLHGDVLQLKLIFSSFHIVN